MTRPQTTAHDRPSIANKLAVLARENRVGTFSIDDGTAHIRALSGTTASGTSDLNTSAAVRVSRTT